MLQNYRSKVNKLLAEYEHAKRQVVDEKRSLIDARKIEADLGESQKFVQAVAEQVQNLAHQQVASIVTRCLKAVFNDDAYDFNIAFEQKRNKTEAKLSFGRNGMEFDPCSSTGGGAVDVASFGLRLVSLLLNRPAKRRLLVLDEPFSRVRGSEYQENVNEMLPTLARELDVQIVCVGDTWLDTDGKIVEL